MNFVLLSGGSGKRLWPLSNDSRSKQFLQLFQNDQGEYQSMVQRMYQQIRAVDKAANITVATSESQVAYIRNQLGDAVDICLEPCRRDTFPAIALATAYLHDVQGLGLDEIVVVLPVDPFVEKSYFEALAQLAALAQSSSANLCLMGIEPTYPSTEYGYIIPKTKNNESPVETFREKPDAETAKQYISQGALWNAGVFAFKLGYVLQKAHELMDFTGYADLFDKYEVLNKISFDYAVVEHEPSIEVMRYAGMWKDLGTWKNLTESLPDNIIGKAILNESCENVHIVNELDVPILCMGLKNVIICATAEGILISDKEQASHIKPYVDEIDQ